MTFPRHVYCSPGPYTKTSAHPTWGCATVNDEADMADALETGRWFATREEAILAAGDKAYPTFKGRMRARLMKQRRAIRPPDEDAPPTRTEMEAQAKLLGIGYNSRTSDQVLLSRITEAMSSGVHQTTVR